MSLKPNSLPPPDLSNPHNLKYAQILAPLIGPKTKGKSDSQPSNPSKDGSLRIEKTDRYSRLTTVYLGNLSFKSTLKIISKGFRCFGWIQGISHCILSVAKGFGKILYVPTDSCELHQANSSFCLTEVSDPRPIQNYGFAKISKDHSIPVWVNEVNYHKCEITTGPFLSVEELSRLNEELSNKEPELLQLPNLASPQKVHMSISKVKPLGNSMALSTDVTLQEMQELSFLSISNQASLECGTITNANAPFHDIPDNCFLEPTLIPHVSLNPEITLQPQPHCLNSPFKDLAKCKVSAVDPTHAFPFLDSCLDKDCLSWCAICRKNIQKAKDRKSNGNCKAISPSHRSPPKTQKTKSKSKCSVPLDDLDDALFQGTYVDDLTGDELSTASKFVKPSKQEIEKQVIWQQLSVIASKWSGPLCILGDFSSTCAPDERLREALQNAKFTGFLQGIKFEEHRTINHSQLADDTIIFTHPSVQELKHIKDILNFFEQVLRLKMNPSKTALYEINIPAHQLSILAEVFQCNVGLFPFDYLGIPIGAILRRVVTWLPIVQRFKKKLVGWKGRCLSFRGRNFLWGGESSKSKISLIKWEVVCKPKELGGLGVVPLRIKNLSLLAKWWSKLNSNKESLWKTILQNSYCSILKKLITYKCGDGKLISFWNDSWMGNFMLRNKYPQLYCLSKNHDGMINQFYFSLVGSLTSYNLDISMPLSIYESQEVGSLLLMLRNAFLDIFVEDSIIWILLRMYSSEVRARAEWSCSLWSRNKLDGYQWSGVQSLRRNFLWGGESSKSKISLIKWEAVCKPKELGGLGKCGDGGPLISWNLDISMSLSTYESREADSLLLMLRNAFLDIFVEDSIIWNPSLVDCPYCTWSQKPSKLTSADAHP
nr:putative ribonuclease H protein At1g65750 family [Tanacetum cinerariifolium]